MFGVRLCFLLILLTGSTHASLNEVLYARQLLNHVTPARVVRFDIVDGPGATPQAVYSLVFDFNHVLWAYLPSGGSAPLGRLDSPAKLTRELITQRLHDADARIHSVTVYENDGSTLHLPPRNLDNGCLLGCILELVNLLECGESIQQAGIVFLNGDQPPSDTRAPASRLLAHQGHAILVYRTPRYWVGYDPNAAGQPIDLSDIRLGNATDSRLLRHAARLNYPASRARYLPVSADALEHLSNDTLWLRQLERRDTESPVF